MVSSELSSQADFFVHPDFYRLGGWHITAEVEQYEAALQQRIDDSPLPVLIYDSSAASRGDFWGRFPQRQRFRTYHGGGYLRNDETRLSFNRLLSEQEVLRGVVHGGYLGACVSAFRDSLRAHSMTGVTYVPTPIDPAYGYDAPRAKDVSYGIVLSRNAILSEIYSAAQIFVVD
jgi:hypothetical protein